MADARSDQASTYRRLYKTMRWQRLRQMVLSAHPLCSMCLLAGSVEAATVVDHVTPHRGDQELFWSVANLQAICKRCHDRDKQATEHGGLAYHGTPDADGWPTDPRHPANRRG